MKSGADERQLNAVITAIVELRKKHHVEPFNKKEVSAMILVDGKIGKKRFESFKNLEGVNSVLDIEVKIKFG